MGDLAGLLLVNLLFLAAGIGVTALCGLWAGRVELLRAIGISYLAGVAVYGVLAQALLVSGASMARWQVVAACLIPAAASLGGFARTRAKKPSPRRSRERWLVLPVVAMLALLAVDLWYQPLWAYDSWTFWTPKAHALYALNGLKPGWFTNADLTSPDYPILLPSIEAAGFRFTGYEVRLLDLQSLFIFGGFLRAFYEVAAPRARSVVLWAVLAMLVAAPSAASQLAAAEADIPTAAFVACSALLGVVWLHDRSRSALAVSAVLAAGACATKVEGLIFTLALAISLAVVTALGKQPKAGGAPIIAFACAIAAGVLPWRLWVSHHHIVNQATVGRGTNVSFLVHHLGRAPLAVAYLGAKLLDPRAWLLIVPLAAIVATVAWRRSRAPEAAVLALFFALSVAGLALAYWSTRLGIHYQLSTSARRVVTSIVFTAAVLTPMLAPKRPSD